MSGFHDYFSLADKDLSAARLIVFSGCSGSGKSSYMRFLSQKHPDFRGTNSSLIDTGRPLEWPRIDKNTLAQLVLVDECLVRRDVVQIARLLRQGHTVIAASHLPPYAFAPLGLVWKSRHFALDRHVGKIAHELEQRDYCFTADAVSRFVKQHGASYSALDMVVENADTPDFDAAFARFEKFNRVEVIRNYRQGR